MKEKSCTLTKLTTTAVFALGLFLLFGPALASAAPLDLNSNLGLVASPYHQTILLPPISTADLDASRNQSTNEASRRLQIGLARSLDQAVVVNRDTITPDGWTVLQNGWQVLSIQVTSAGAVGLRLHLESLTLPQGAQLVVADPAKPDSVLSTISATSLAGRRELWTDSIFSDHAVIQLQVPPGVDPAGASVTVASLSHLFMLPFVPSNLKEGTCHNDVTCYPEWAQEAAGVARMSFVDAGNTYLCTGCLLATSDPSQAADYFLTANHCVGGQGIASSIELFWFYQTTSCNGTPPDLTTVQHTGGGAEFLAGSTVSDFTFLRLRQASPAGATHLTWTLNPPSSGETLTGIHHPDGAYKRISFGNFDGGDSDFWAVQWTSGVTEPGSSGSPLFNSSHQIIGQLNGGFNGPGSSCDDPSAPDQYGRFDVTYEAIKQWLGNSVGTPQVNFVKGTYNGLFKTSDALVQGSSGSFTLTDTAKGKFSGRLQSGSAHYSFVGQFDINGAAQVSVRRGALTPITMSLQVDPQDSDRVTGSLTDGNWNADLAADRAVFDGRNNIAPQVGRYTMVIPGDPNSTTDPGGNSFGTLSVDKAGRVLLSGSLADGTRISQSSGVSKNGQWPLYISLYSGQGALFSWINFNGDGSLGGDVSWTKAASAKSKLYSQGFSTGKSVVGSSYSRPPVGNTVLGFTDGTLILDGGDLAQNLFYQIAIANNNRVTAPNGEKLTVTFSLTTGAFTGRVVDPVSGKSISFQGVVLQNQNVAEGFFLGSDQSGEVKLGP